MLQDSAVNETGIAGVSEWDRSCLKDSSVKLSPVLDTEPLLKPGNEATLQDSAVNETGIAGVSEWDRSCLKDGSVKLSLRNETGEGPGDSEYDDFESFVNLRLLLSSASESNFRSRSGLDAPNLPEALLRFPSLATDRLLALLGVGEGGLAVFKLEPEMEWTDAFIMLGSTSTDILCSTSSSVMIFVKTVLRYAFTFLIIRASLYIPFASGAFLAPPFLFMVAYFDVWSFSFMAITLSGTLRRGALHIAVSARISFATSLSFSILIKPSTLLLLPMSTKARSLETMG